MKTRINNSQYRKYLKEVKSFADLLGVTVVIHRRAIIWSRYGSQGPNFSEVRGYHDMYKKKIVVTLHGRPARRKVLHVLAHELRHALHVKEGLYKNYYNPKVGRCIDLLLKGVKIDAKMIVRPSNLVALMAERDCDKFADKWLADRNIKAMNLSPYPNYMTIAYQINQYFDRYLAGKL